MIKRWMQSIIQSQMPNFNGAAAEVWELIRNKNLHLTGPVIIDPSRD